MALCVCFPQQALEKLPQRKREQRNAVRFTTSGALIARQTYFPYGAPRTSAGTLPTDYTFTGQRVDASAGLMYYNARYYDAALARFISADTLVPNPYNPQDLNRYTYTRNNPLKYVDPSGHDIIIVGGAGWDWLSGGKDPYDDPGWWERWIVEYTGWTHDQYVEKFYNPWMNAKSDADKMRIASETGVAVFKWDNVLGWEQVGSVTEAARKLQQQINEWGLKDVTIVGHSKGGKVIEALLGMYENGTLVKGEVKNMVAIDPPQGIRGLLFGGNPKPDAVNAGIGVVSISLQASCGNVSCSSNIKRDIEISPGVPPANYTHDLPNHLAGHVFTALGVSGDAHARSVPLGW